MTSAQARYPHRLISLDQCLKRIGTARMLGNDASKLRNGLRDHAQIILDTAGKPDLFPAGYHLSGSYGVGDVIHVRKGAEVRGWGQ